MHSSTNDLIDLTEIAKELIYHISDPKLVGQRIPGIESLILGKPITQLKDLSQAEKAMIANQVFIQISYEFTSSPELVSVKDSITLEKTALYSDLPKIQLNEEQQKKVAEFLAKNEKNPNFYNGEHIVVERMLHDATKNIIYFVPKATDYATMSALPEVLSANYFRLGVISPIITKNSFTYLLERNDLLKLWSSVAGLIQPVKGSLENLLNCTAENEFIEEIVGDQNGIPRNDHLIKEIVTNQISLRALHCSKDSPSIQIPTAEFIAPIFLKINSEEFEKDYLKYNCAKDRKDHTVVESEIIGGVEYVHNKYCKVNLNSLESILKALYSGESGNFLYFPIITSALAVVGVNLKNEEFRELTKISAEELAEKLLFEQPQKYILTVDTPHLSAIVKRILETQPVERQKQVLTKEIVEAALSYKDEHHAGITELLDNSELSKELTENNQLWTKSLLQYSEGYNLGNH